MKRLISIIILTQLTFLNADNYSLSFDGVDDYINVPSSSSLNNLSTITFMCYAKANAFANNEDYLLKSWSSNGFREWGFRVNGNGNPHHIWAEFIINGTYQTIGADHNNYTVSTNTYYHLAVTYNGNTVKLYQDGVLVGSLPITGTLDGNPNNIFLANDGDNNCWDGLIDNFSIWDTALTQSEIQSYMATSPTGSESGLVSYWDFNEGSGTTVIDQTGNGNHGTIHGATWVER